MKRSILVLAAMSFFLTLPSAGEKSESGSKKKITISGTITGQNNKPVSGAQIYVDSINTGTVTNGLGKYKIKVSPGVKTMIASSTEYGYGQAEINDSKTVNITLNGDIKNLTVFLARNTRLTDPPKADKPKKINTYTDIYQMIRQEVPGVLVNGRSIVIQQQNSFFGSTQPLFVVNGVRVNSIDYINPLEVKSIQLLKGSSANIYGNDGANGVISITLKSGSDK